MELFLPVPLIFIESLIINFKVSLLLSIRKKSKCLISSETICNTFITHVYISIPQTLEEKTLGLPAFPFTSSVHVRKVTTLKSRHPYQQHFSLWPLCSVWQGGPFYLIISGPQGKGLI